jgi:hypothetical protein
MHDKEYRSAVNQLQWAIILSYYQNCPAKTTHSPRRVPWWNKKLNWLRAKTKKLFNTAKRTSQWDTHKGTLTCYNKEIRKAKRSSWRRYCQEINDVPGGARLIKIMEKQAANKVSTIKLPDGQHTQTRKETLKELFRIHFLDSKLTDNSGDGQDQQNLGICEHITYRGNWDLAKRAINQSKIRQALSAFKPFKSAGTDGIAPALLQQGAEHLVLHLCHIFRACMAYEFTPPTWRQVKLTFIPKPRKLDYTEAKAYRPISLSSFLLKKMEKLVDRHIRDGALRIHPLHRNQHAYQTGKSNETALHNVVTCTKYATEHKALGAFLNKEEAFDRTSFDTI